MSEKIFKKKDWTGIKQEFVLYEDNHLLVLFKPAGLLTQGDQTGDPTLIELARKYIGEKYNKPGKVYLGLVHRLDRPACGIVAFARTSKAAKRLCESFKSHQIKKIYWAIIQGNLEPPFGELKDYMTRHGRHSFISKPEAPKAQVAVLSYKNIKSFSGLSLLEITLGTGRHHQIRVQLAHRGHPIIGDMKYGSKFKIQGGNIALLAKRLEFVHPTKSDKLIIESPVPHDWPWPVQEKL